MPQPFSDQMMEDLQKLTMDQLKEAATKGLTNRSEIMVTEKVAELAHFLVHNYRNELSPDEHVIDTAIRLLSKK